MIDPMPRLKDKLDAQKAALEAELQATEHDIKRAKKVTKPKH